MSAPPAARGATRAPRAPRASLAVLAVLAVLCAGCGPKYLRETVLSEGGIDVRLRSEERGGQAVPRGFAHPARIAGVRLAHILGRLDVQPERGASGDREAAVPLEHLYELADALSLALSKASPDQEVVARVQQRRRRLGLFTETRLTSLVAFVRGDQLELHFVHVDWPLPKGPDEKLPEPFVGRPAMKFRLLPAEAMTPLGTQALAVTWRDPIFRKPLSVRLSPEGRRLRRTILMEAPEVEDEVPRVATPPGVEALSPETLRELADLEEARRQGEVSETDYQARRRQILREDAAEAR